MHPGNLKFEKVKGEDIRYWYHYEQYADGCNTLNGSCMGDDDCQPYFDLYVNNPKVCNLLILKGDDNKIRGRALLWTFKDSDGNEVKLMDRIYGKDSTIERFKRWATKNGYWYNERQSYDHRTGWFDLERNVV